MKHDPSLSPAPQDAIDVQLHGWRVPREPLIPLALVIDLYDVMCRHAGRPVAETLLPILKPLAECDAALLEQEVEALRRKPGISDFWQCKFVPPPHTSRQKALRHLREIHTALDGMLTSLDAYSQELSNDWETLPPFLTKMRQLKDHIGQVPEVATIGDVLARLKTSTSPAGRQ